MSWTEERVEKLRELWTEGMSASQIAKTLGGVTRNAVIGKVHRLGLSNRSGGPAPEEAKPAEKRAPEPAAAAPAEEPPAAAEPEMPGAPGEHGAHGEHGEHGEPGEAEEAPPAAAPARAQQAPRDASQPRAPGLPTPEEMAARETLAEIEKMARRLDLLDLTERTCKWPIGDPAEEEFYFCGLPSVPGKPYCEHHVAVAFQPLSTRRDRARSGR